MEKVFEFLNNCQTYYLATIGLDKKPKVRPMGTILKYENKLYFQTAKVKNVFKEIEKNKSIEITAWDGFTWIRISADAIIDNRYIIQEAMLKKYPELQSLYTPGDDNTVVIYLKDCVATFYFMGRSPEVIKF
jgi:uncharacterized pyridoxamine 5'-phosphate oxidase family protein